MMFSNAEAYDRFMGRWSRIVAPLLVDFAAVPAAGRILDVGSGLGTVAFEIAKRNAAPVTVTGIDPSREFVAYAMNRNPFPERASFYVGGALGLPFEDGTFAASLSSLVFNFVADAKKALQEVRRVTEPAGRITAAVWDYSDVMGMLRTFWDAAADVDARAESLDEKHMPLCRAGELSHLWEQGGLQNVHEQSLDITMKFDSFPDYWEPFLLGQGPAGAYLRTVPPDRLQVLRSALKARLPLSSQTDAFILPARVWAVRGTVP
jgi:SAM-dependent methyltransferase